MTIRYIEPQPMGFVRGFVSYPVTGDCQEPVICDGDMIYVDKSIEPSEGDYVLYRHSLWRYHLKPEGQLSNRYRVFSPADHEFEGVVRMVSKAKARV